MRSKDNWLLFAEEYSPYEKVKEYKLTTTAIDIRIRAVQVAIRISSGARWATDGFYLISPGKKAIKFSTLQEAKRAGEAITGGAR